MLTLCECWFGYDAIQNGRHYRLAPLWCEDAQQIVDLRFLREVSPRGQFSATNVERQLGCTSLLRRMVDEEIVPPPI